MHIKALGRTNGINSSRKDLQEIRIFLKNSPASEETSEAKDGTFSSFLLFGVSYWLCG